MSEFDPIELEAALLEFQDCDMHIREAQRKGMRPLPGAIEERAAAALIIARHISKRIMPRMGHSIREFMLDSDDEMGADRCRGSDSFHRGGSGPDRPID